MPLAPFVDIANRHSDQMATSARSNLPSGIQDYVATAVVNPKRLVKFDTPVGQVIQSAAAADLHIGVSLNDVVCKALDTIPVGVYGIVQVEAGAAITQGVSLSSDSVGRAILAVATAASWGIALEAATAAGQIIKARIGARAILA